jgi:Carboxypeptidase regulatory-like domain
MAERSAWAPIALLLVLLAAGAGIWWSLSGSDDEILLDGEGNPIVADDTVDEGGARRRAGEGKEEAAAEGTESEAAPDLDATDTEAAKVRGLVVDSVSGQEIVGIEILAEALDGGAIRKCRSVAAGAFELDLNPGSWRLKAQAAGKASAFVSVASIVAGEERDLGVILVQPSSRVVGRVVDAKLQPIEGLDIALFQGAGFNPADGGLDFFSLIEDILDPPPAFAKTKSAKDGTFSFDGVLNGDYAVAAEGEGWRRALSKRRRIDDRVGEARFELVMVPGLTLNGRCVDESELPVAGVKLIVIAEPNGMPGPGSTRITYSGEDGRFVVSGVDALEHQVIARSPNHAARGQLRAKPGEEVVVRLTGGARVSGLVRDVETGQAIPGLKLMLMSNQAPVILECVSDEEGRYEFAHAPQTEAFMLMLRSDQFFIQSAPGEESARGFPGASGVVSIPGTEAPRSVVERDILVVRGGTIEGTVLDADTGKGIAGAQVRVMGGGGPFGMGTGNREAVMTKDDGSYRLTNVQPGMVSVTATHPEYAPPGMEEIQKMFGGLRGGEPDPAKMIASGETKRGQDIRLRRGLVLSGRVVNEAGEPVARARVEVKNGGGFGFAMMAGMKPRESFSDAEGKFEIRGVGAIAAPNEDEDSSPFFGMMKTMIIASHPNFAGGGTAELKMQSGDRFEAVEIVMKRGASVNGQLLGEDGQPAAGRVIEMEVENEAAGAGTMMDAITGRDRNTFRATTNADGRFAVPSMPNGEVTVSLEDGRPGIIDPKSRSFSLASGEKKEILIRLQPTLTITGVVVDQDGQPVRASVSADVEGLPWSAGLSVECEDDGSFTLSGIPEGSEASVSAWYWDRGGNDTVAYEPARMEAVKAGARGLRLVMTRRKN